MSRATKYQTSGPSLGREFEPVHKASFGPRSSPAGDKVTATVGHDDGRLPGRINIYIRATLKHVRLTLVFLGFPRRVALPSLEILDGEWKFQLAFQARWTDVYLASLCVHRHYSDTPDKATHSTSSSSLILLVGLDLGSRSRHADPASAYPSAFTRVSSTVAPVACRWCPEEARDGGARHA